MTIDVIKAVKNYKAWVVPAILFVAVFVLGSSPAEARTAVEGSREFRDDVNECLSTYRGASGIVGDVIKELENSTNEHRITESPDWSNISNNGADESNGTGTGTVTRVDKDELEEYKRDFEELRNKDFCTALLHELWHAVDADRGTSTNDELDGVNRNEIEATMFQNFIHALRGVDPRTTYSGVDISEHVLISEERATPTPTLTPTPTEVKTSVSTSFQHVKPGEYSEIYAAVKTKPGAKVNAKLTGPGVSGSADQNKIADANGVAKFTWKIVSYGSYTVDGTADGGKFNSTIDIDGKIIICGLPGGPACPPR